MKRMRRIAAIALYRAYAGNLCVRGHLGIEYSSAFYEAVNRYLDGAIDADAMIREMDRMYRMMVQEGA